MSTNQPLTAPQLALNTAKWARTMTKWLITRSNKKGVKWQLVEFKGKKGQESAGIVDILAVRKNHHPTDAEWKRGDLLEMVLVQCKGGSAAPPTDADVQRMIKVKKHHNAHRVVLFEWKKGTALRCFDLEKPGRPAVRVEDVFGTVPPAAKIKKAAMEAANTEPSGEVASDLRAAA